MNFNALKAFVLTAELGSISAAAKVMGKGRVQVSQWISNLEIDWGVNLFNREGHKPELTVEAEHLLYKSRKVLLSSKMLEEQVDLIGSQQLTTIRLGVSCYVKEHIIVEFISRFRKEHSKLSIEVTLAGDDDLLRSDDFNKSYDYLLCFYPHAAINTWRFNDLCNKNFLVVSAAGHTLADKEEVSSLDLSEHPNICFRHQSTESYWYPTQNFKLFEVDSVSLIKQLVIDGQGWAIMPKDLIEEELKRNDLVIVNHLDAVQPGKLGVGRKEHMVESTLSIWIYEQFRQLFNH